MKSYAIIVLDTAMLNIDKLFTYKIKHNQIEKIFVGQKVLVPFGTQDELLEGIVVDLVEDTDIDNSKLKTVEVLVDGPILPGDLVKLGIWIKESFFCTYTDAFRLIYPTGVSAKSDKEIELSEDKMQIAAESSNDILKYLAQKRVLKLSELNRIFTKSKVTKFLSDDDIFDIVKIKDIYEIKQNIQYDKFIKINTDKDKSDVIQELRKSSKQLELYKFMENKDWINVKDIVGLGFSGAIMKALIDKSIVISKQESKNRFENPYKNIGKTYKLTEEQQIQFEKSISSDKKVQLFYGVTGSGKTILYIEWIKRMMDLNKTSILLVPEIALTPQTIRIFTEIFGEKVAVLHSKLSIGEKFDEWRKIELGEAKIIIGARSAIFAPCKNLGLVVIDEEHENSYKSGMNPRYDTIEVAKKRCNLVGAKLILGSATPSLETFYKVEQGEYEYIHLANRVYNRLMPKVKIVDMKIELEQGNKSFISKELYHSIKNNYEKKEQTILFINRRGFSNSISCRKCGYVMKCSDCDISMTYHTTTKRLHCHYCGKTIITPENCPECGSKYFKTFGLGTQKVEEGIRRLFPDIKIARMDADTTQKKGSHEKILNKFKNDNYDVLIGTQMITKGLDLHNVTLVGILAAELSLNIPDFRAPEKTFQLLTQVSGRAGRGEKEGKVILQTYNPEHYAVVCAQKQAYLDFYKQEIKIREDFEYPPFSKIILIQISGENELDVIDISKKLGEIFSTKDFEYLGPNPSPIAKIQKKHRWQMVFKVNQISFDKFKKVYENEIQKIKIIGKRKGIIIIVDVDPNTVL